MMNYNQFSKNFTENLKKHMPDSYKEWVVETSRAPKVNGYMDAVCLVPKVRDGNFAVPNLYLAQYYDYYQCCMSMEKTLKKAAEMFTRGMEYIEEMKVDINLIEKKDDIIMALINREHNTELLESVPHRSLMDIEIIYRLMVRLPDDTFNSAIITGEMAKEMGLAENDLYNIAKENTPKIMPIKHIMLPEDMYILTNKYKMYGATVALYDGALAEIAEEMGNDLLLMPSSIHEFFIIPDYGNSIEALRDIVADANMKVVSKEEILSASVYFYDRRKRELRIA